ncbi:hypothetical protein PCE1_003257 [Barthelona sp. PCE]
MVFVVRAQLTSQEYDNPVHVTVSFTETERGYVSIHFDNIEHPQKVFGVHQFFKDLDVSAKRLKSPEIGILDFEINDRESLELSQLSLTHSQSHMDKLVQETDSIELNENFDEFSFVESESEGDPFPVLNNNESMNNDFNHLINGVIHARRQPSFRLELNRGNSSVRERTLQKSVSDLNTAAISDSIWDNPGNQFMGQAYEEPSSEESISGANMRSIVTGAGQMVNSPYIERELDTQHGTPEQINGNMINYGPIINEDDKIHSDTKTEGVVVNQLDSNGSFNSFELEQPYNINIVLTGQNSSEISQKREASTADEQLNKFKKLQKRFQQQQKFFKRCGVSQEYLYSLSGINAFLSNKKGYLKVYGEAETSNSTDVITLIHRREAIDMSLVTQNVDITGVPRNI